MEMRLAVINAQSAVSTTKGYWHYLTTAWRYALPHSHNPIVQAGVILQDERIDLALCTELSGSSFRSGRASQADLLRASSGLPYAHYFSAASALLYDEGNALISRYPLYEPTHHTLPSGSMQRILAETVVEVEGMRIRVFVAHLALNLLERTGQIQKIAELISGVKEPCILGGDFNEPAQDAFEVLTQMGFEQIALPTYPSWRPKRHLDQLFVRGFSVKNASVHKGRQFSDHAPLLVTLSLK